MANSARSCSQAVGERKATFISEVVRDGRRRPSPVHEMSEATQDMSSDWRNRTSRISTHPAKTGGARAILPLPYRLSFVRLERRAVNAAVAIDTIALSPP